MPVSGAFIAIGHEPQSALVRGPDRPRRERLRGHRGQLHAHQPPRRVRGRRPRRPHLPPGDHRRRLGLSGGARRRVVPARHARGADARRRCPRAIWPRPSGRPRRAATLAPVERLERARRALELEQPALALEAAAVAAERAAAAQHAVAGIDDRDRVRAQGVARRARAARAAGVGGDLAVAEHAAVGDLRGHAPARAGANGPIERPVERAARRRACFPRSTPRARAAPGRAAPGPPRSAARCARARRSSTASTSSSGNARRTSPRVRGGARAACRTASPPARSSRRPVLRRRSAR